MLPGMRTGFKECLFVDKLQGPWWARCGMGVWREGLM